jgi:hypothetical protein
MINFLDIIFNFLFEMSFWRPGLALWIGPNRVSILPENGDIQVSETSCKIKIKTMGNIQKLDHCAGSSELNEREQLT